MCLYHLKNWLQTENRKQTDSGVYIELLTNQCDSRTGVAGVVLAILGLALLSIIIFLGVCNSQQIVLHCTTTWRQPGLDRGFVDRLQKLVTNKQTNRKQKTNRQRCLQSCSRNLKFHITKTKHELSCFQVGVPHLNRPLLPSVVKPLFEVSLCES